MCVHVLVAHSFASSPILLDVPDVELALEDWLEADVGLSSDFGGSGPVPTPGDGLVTDNGPLSGIDGNELLC